MQITLAPHICVYLDVLGGANIFSGKIDDKAEFFLESMLEFERRFNGMRPDGVPVVRTFTDNIFAALPLTMHAKLSIGNKVAYFLQEVAQQMQQFFLIAELPMRGAVTIGNMFIDERFVFGPAVVKAVEAEKKAIFPRVVLDESVLQALPHLPLIQETIVYTGADGIPSLNYLGLQFWLLKRHREFASESLSKHHTQPTIAAKYRWLLNYTDDIEARVKLLGLTP